MDSNKFPIFKNQLEDIRASLLGNVAKKLKSSQEDFVDAEPDITDDAARSTNRQLMLNLGEQDWGQLKQVEEALDNIKKGIYGICKNCEKPIPEARLELVPFARHCVQCLESIEEERRLDKLNNKELN